MKRFHVHVAVANLDQSTKFYTNLFGSPPAVQKEDYVKWMLEDPRINFAISARGHEPGLNHLGIQAENETELNDVSDRLRSASTEVLDQGVTTCCYVKSKKAWVVDPQGITWETFLSIDESTVYGDDDEVNAALDTLRKTACCAPSAETVQLDIKRQ